MNLLLGAVTGLLCLQAMQYEATIEVGAGAVRAVWSERSGAAALDVAEGEVRTRQYSAWLDRTAALEVGASYWVTYRGKRFVAYVARQTGRSVRFTRRDGEFYPGLVLERLGTFPGSPWIASGGDGWFLVRDFLSAFKTRAFDVYEDIQVLYDEALGASVLAGSEVVMGTYEALVYSADGQLWGEVALPGGEEVNALAWDGAQVWAACTQKLFTIDWSTKAVTEKAVGTFYGLSQDWPNPFPHYAEQAAGGGYDLFHSNGTPYRHVDFDTYWWNDWIKAGSAGVGNDRHVTCDNAGVVWDFGKFDEVQVGQVAQGARKDYAPGTFKLADVVLVVAYGQLLRIDGGPGGGVLVPVYDFGDDVFGYPSLRGPLIAADAGDIYRVRLL